VPMSDSSDGGSGASTFVLLLGILALAWAATWVLPKGAYEREVGDDGRQRVVAGTYAAIPDEERRNLGPQAIALAVPVGLDRAREVLFFILIVGGAFRVLRETGAAEAAIGHVLRRFGRYRNQLLLAGLAVFAAGSSTIGMAEEYLPFVPVLVLFGLGLGLDRTAAVGIVIIGAAVGYGTAVINPFTLLVAQGICELPPTSGMTYRLLLTVPFLLLAFDHLRRHANRLDRARSAAAERDRTSHGDEGAKSEDRDEAAHTPPPMTIRRGLILGCLVLAIAGIVVGVKFDDWHLHEMMALFLAAAVCIGIVGGLGASQMAGLFARGASELAPTALLIGFAYAILVLLENGQVVDSVIHGIAIPLEQLGGGLAAVGMLAVQSVCNVIVPSGSGQAGVTMPIMAAVADLTGVSRQTAVLAFQFGDGLTNMIVPTNVVLLGMLSMAGVTYGQWVRFVWPLVVRMLLLAALALLVAVWFGYQ